MTIRVTVTQPNVFDSYGIRMVVGTIYTVEDNFGFSLIQSGRATDTDLSLVSPGVGSSARRNIIYVNAATIAAPTASMLGDINAVYALDVAPFTRYQSNGTALV